MQATNEGAGSSTDNQVSVRDRIESHLEKIRKTQYESLGEKIQKNQVDILTPKNNVYGSLCQIYFDSSNGILIVGDDVCEAVKWAYNDSNVGIAFTPSLSPEERKGALGVALRGKGPQDLQREAIARVLEAHEASGYKPLLFSKERHEELMLPQIYQLSVIANDDLQEKLAKALGEKDPLTIQDLRGETIGTLYFYPLKQDLFAISRATEFSLPKPKEAGETPDIIKGEEVLRRAATEAGALGENKKIAPSTEEIGGVIHDEEDEGLLRILGDEKKPKDRVDYVPGKIPHLVNGLDVLSRDIETPPKPEEKTTTVEGTSNITSDIATDPKKTYVAGAVIYNGDKTHEFMETNGLNSGTHATDKKKASRITRVFDGYVWVVDEQGNKVENLGPVGKVKFHP